MNYTLKKHIELISIQPIKIINRHLQSKQQVFTNTRTLTHRDPYTPTLPFRPSVLVCTVHCIVHLFNVASGFHSQVLCGVMVSIKRKVHLISIDFQHSHTYIMLYVYIFHRHTHTHTCTSLHRI